MSKIYIDNGVNIDASWVNSIAVSSDGVNWDTINKHQIDVRKTFREGTKSPVNPKGNQGRINLGRSDDQILLTFDPDDVVNQLTWNGNTLAGLQKAVADISGWLN